MNARVKDPVSNSSSDEGDLEEALYQETEEELAFSPEARDTAIRFAGIKQAVVELLASQSIVEEEKGRISEDESDEEEDDFSVKKNNLDSERYVELFDVIEEKSSFDLGLAVMKMRRQTIAAGGQNFRTKSALVNSILNPVKLVNKMLDTSQELISDAGKIINLIKVEEKSEEQEIEEFQRMMDQQFSKIPIKLRNFAYYHSKNKFLIDFSEHKKYFFQQDASNNLSRGKMAYVRSLRHLRKGKKQDEFYPIIGTNMGFIPFKSDIETEAGSGVVIYFKLVKFLTLIFFILTLLNFPSFFFFFQGETSLYSTKTYEDLLLAFTLGNLGEATFNCVYDQMDNETAENTATLPFTCAYGKIQRLQYFGLGVPEQTDCKHDVTNFYNSTLELQPLCNYGIGVNQTVFNNSFDAHCLGQRTCSFQVNTTFFEGECAAKAIAGNEIYGQVVCMSLEMEILDGIEIEKKWVAIGVVLTDFFSMFVLALSVVVLEYISDLNESRLQKNTIRVEDFTVKVQGFPSKQEYKNNQNLKTELWLRFEKIAQNTPQKILKFKDSKYNSEIVNIYFGHKHYNQLEKMVKTIKTIDKYVSLDSMLKDCTLTQQERETFFQLRDEQAIELINLTKLQQKVEWEEVEPVCAFIMFRSQEGAFRVKHAFYEANRKRKCLCCRVKNPQNLLLFKKHEVSVAEAPSPDVILWKNLGVTLLELAFRIVLSFVASFIIILITTYIVSAVDDEYSSLQASQSELQCNTPIDQTQALDYFFSQKSSYLLDCYCEQQYVVMGSSVQEIEFENGKYYCDIWYTDYNKSKALSYSVSIAVSVTNIIIEVALEVLSHWERRRNLDKNVYSTMLKTFIARTFNTIVVIMLVNIHLDVEFPLPKILNGYFYQCTVQWYRDVGVSLILTMLITVVTPHISKSIKAFLWKFQLYKDRGYTHDETKTKKYVQSEYENVNFAPPFVFEFRYTNLLYVIWVTLFFSAGMPILYLIAFLCFLVTYWFDKIMLLRYSRIPPNFAFKVHRKTLELIKWAIILHFIMGYYMLTYPAILPSNTLFLDSNFEQLFKGNAYINIFRVVQIHALLYCLGFCIVIAVFFGKWASDGYKFAQESQKNQAKKISLYKVCDDYYNRLHLNQLVKEYFENKAEVRKVQKHLSKYQPVVPLGQMNNPLIKKRKGQHEVNLGQYLKRLSRKQYMIFKMIHNKYIKHSALIRQQSSQLKDEDEVNDFLDVEHRRERQNTKYVTNFHDALQLLFSNEKQTNLIQESQFEGQLYNYDVQETDDFYGTYELQNFLKEQRGEINRATMMSIGVGYDVEKQEVIYKMDPKFKQQ